jgi:putative two-component system response regulator
MTALRRWRILTIDDEPANLFLVESILEDDYEVKTDADPFKGLESAVGFRPDLILLDIMMPRMDGYETCRRLKSNPETARIPVIFFSAMDDDEHQKTGFDIGGVDFIGKPVSPPILLARVATHLKLSNQQKATEELVRARTQELQASQRAAVFMLGEAGHYNDTDTGVHIWRMGAYAGAIARAANWHVDKADMLELAAPMHDTGKIGTPDAILKKPGPLDEKEWQIMRTHPAIGYNILAKSNTPLFDMAADIALCHHEKWDGSGYPRGLSGANIPESARIVAIADVFDALTMRRPYKPAWPIEKALDEIRRITGKHFDPELAQRFLDIGDEVRQIKTDWDRREAEMSASDYFNDICDPIAGKT